MEQFQKGLKQLSLRFTNNRIIPKRDDVNLLVACWGNAYYGMQPEDAMIIDAIIDMVQG